MSVSQNVMTVPTGGYSPQEYMLNLSKAISEVFMLVLERRELDLGDDETRALHVLAMLQSELVAWRD